MKNNNKTLKNQIISISLISFAFLLFIILIFPNSTGIAGRLINKIVILPLGISGILIPFILFFMGIKKLKKQVVSTVLIIGSILLVLSCSILAATYMQKGGIIGTTLSEFLYKYFKLASHIIIITLFIIAVVMINHGLQIRIKKTNKKNIKDSYYNKPPLSLLSDKEETIKITKENSTKSIANKLENILKKFNIATSIYEIHEGPCITSFYIKLNEGVKISKVMNLSDDIALALGRAPIRIEAPVENRSLVSIEVPKNNREEVLLKDVLSYTINGNGNSIILGKDIRGRLVKVELENLPHLLIGGTTGSGKSVCLRSIITNLIFNASPLEILFLIIDPKMVELKIFDGMPYLILPVITDSENALGVLNWSIKEMEKRYKLLSTYKANDINEYNNKIEKNNNKTRQVDYFGLVSLNENYNTYLPRIVIIIDELAELMLYSQAAVQQAIIRLAQIGRAVGMHLIIATQRPSVDVITGLIKANFSARIAMKTASKIDSKIILDAPGAEKLLGKGDMLFICTSLEKAIRLQGCYISSSDVERVVNYIKENSYLRGPVITNSQLLLKNEVIAGLS